LIPVTTWLPTLLDEFQILDHGFVSMREGFDFLTPARRLISEVLASGAAYDTAVRKELDRYDWEEHAPLP
jgi:hypothetical protein